MLVRLETPLVRGSQHHDARPSPRRYSPPPTHADPASSSTTRSSANGAFLVGLDHHPFAVVVKVGGEAAGGASRLAKEVNEVGSRVGGTYDDTPSR